MIKTISLREAATLLDYKDLRSVEEWCEKRGVKIFSEEESNKKYLIQMQFEHARLKKFIGYLKTKFKDKWLEAFQAYASANIMNVIEIEETGKVKSRPVINEYKASGEHEKEFLSRLVRNKAPEL